MAEYVDIDAVKEAVRGAECDADWDGRRFDAEFIENALDFIPRADVAPVVHARWIPSESDFDDDDTLFDGEECCDWQCSACREDICYEDPMPMKLLPNYCPNCGAKMDGGDNTER